MLIEGKKRVQRVPVRLKARRCQYEIIVGSGILAALGEEARRVSPTPARRVAVISNEKVFGLYGQGVMRSLRAAGFTPVHWLMGDGERHKNIRALESALAFLTDAGLERSDLVVALGGGVVGDLAGFAAAVYLRGLDYLQVPTTLLAQIDASVGGKTAINLGAGKNLAGAFHQPRAVLIDTTTLRTLPRREMTAGWCEAVKQGAAGSRPLFDKTYRFLKDAGKEASRDAGLDGLIAEQCAFKAGIVAGDEREDITLTHPRSRRILNFGHTTAHALESVTGYRRFRHGEAVGYGMLVAGEVSVRLGLLDRSELELLRAAVRLCGRLPRAHDLDQEMILRALSHDKKRVGGQLKWVLLERLGRAIILDQREITPRLLRASFRAALSDPVS
ncbi:MAG: 3-dehydroquinate synthase [Acidobacteria bacterium]|nr:3-dehydroquinate synthase [Acidobacteriota bacterium]